VINGVTTAYVTNDLNQYASVGGAPFAYDADGNLTFDGHNTFEYDQHNRLVQVSGPSGVTEHEYDALGNRISTAHDGERTEYLLDPTGLVSVAVEFGDNGLLTARNVHAVGLVGRGAGIGPLAYADFDGLGSTVGLTSADGTPLNRYAFDPFGAPLLASETIDNDFRFVGQFGVTYDSEHVYFMRNRYLVPQIGRFASLDPWIIPADCASRLVSSS
jgi:YD repeat-containing protein